MKDVFIECTATDITKALVYDVIRIDSAGHKHWNFDYKIHQIYKFAKSAKLTRDPIELTGKSVGCHQTLTRNPLTTAGIV